MGLAREIKVLADILETKTKLQNYDEKDVDRRYRTDSRERSFNFDEDFFPIARF